MSDPTTLDPRDAETLVDLLIRRAELHGDALAYAFLEDGERETSRLTFAELDRAARAMAVMLSEYCPRGSRAILLYPAGVDFWITYWGCQYAGVAAIPVNLSQRKKHVERLRTIAVDAGAAAVLTLGEVVERLGATLPGGGSEIPLVGTDVSTKHLADRWERPPIDRNTPSYFQYTSGSTGTPKGVNVSHGNLLTNLAYTSTLWVPNEDSVAVTWLPFFHDLGLIFGLLFPVFNGFRCYQMSPTAFAQKPLRWLRAISRYRGTHSAAPNFAYDMCVAKTTPEERAELDLSCWRLALNGAEPVRPGTIARFAEAFASTGFELSFECPTYGLAEATLIISGTPIGVEPRLTTVDDAALQENRIERRVAGEPGARTLASSGRIDPGARTVIVDPTTCEACPPDTVGEIWLGGDSVTQGYWEKPEDTRRVFEARIVGREDEGPYLRTGDLGFLEDDYLYVTGRHRDLIIVRGRNYYPQDIELASETSHPLARPGAVAAFALDVDGAERVALVQEVKVTPELDVAEVFGNIRQAVAEEHGIELCAISLIQRGTVLRTTSGKIQRRASRTSFLEGRLDLVAEWRDRTLDWGDGATKAPTVEAVYAPTQAEVEQWLRNHFSEVLDTGPEEIDVTASFFRFGLNSFAAMSLAAKLDDWLEIGLGATAAFDYPNIEALSQHVVALAEARAARAGAPVSTAVAASIAAPASTESAAQSEGIAIIGMGCRFPGASSPDAFWRLLRDGTDAIVEVPESRWRLHDHYDPAHAAEGKAHTRWGGFVDDFDAFEPEFFGISARETQSIDPQQRLLLEVAWEALEDAGLAPDTVRGSDTGVFVGIATNDFARRIAGQPHLQGAHSGPGSVPSIAASRLSYVLDLHGPSWSVDTACSSSLVALANACQSIQLGECDLALAAGVNLVFSPDLTIAFSQAGMMAPDGRCKSFDARADGYVRSEGCGAVVLKRLSDAVRDGDRIDAVIRGWAVNQDGRSNGLTAPNGPSQERVVRRALERAGVGPDRIQYVEAHGTGTQLGDPIEVRALSAALMSERSSDDPLWLGSVKTNIGHLEAAAGIAGLIKTTLALREGQIPPNLHFRNMNAEIRRGGAAVRIPTRLEVWPEGAPTRMAGVSSFGFGGTNAHVVLEEAPRTEASKPASAPAVHVLTLSARHASTLRTLAGAYRDHLRSHPEDAVADVCFTANTGRVQQRHRLAVVASERNALDAALDAVARGVRVAGTHTGEVAASARPKVAFVIAGQGTQRVGMGRALYETEPRFRAILDRADALVRDELPMSLLVALFSETSDDAMLDDTLFAQPVLFAFGWAMAELWRSWGVEPAIVLGHSSGEILAACVAGALDYEDGLRLTMARARLMHDLPEGGGMLGLMVDRTQAESIAAPHPDVVVAAVNGPESTVLSGPSAQLEQIREALVTSGIHATTLRVSHAFHSPLVAPMLPEFERVAAGLDVQPLRIPLVTNVGGAVLPAGHVLEAKDLRRHAAEMVDFDAGVRALLGEGVDTLLELGPHPVFAALHPESDAEWLSSANRDSDDWHVLAESLSALHCRGVRIDWASFEGGAPRRKLSLPTSPYERRRFPVPERAPLGPTTAVPAAGPPVAAAAPLTSSPVSDVGPRLRALMEDVFQSPGMLDDVAFLELGADSILLVQALERIRGEFGVELQLRQFFDELTTLRDVAAYLEARVVPVAPAPVASRSVGTSAGDTVERVLQRQLDAAVRVTSPVMAGALSDLVAQQLQFLGGQAPTSLPMAPRPTPPSSNPRSPAALGSTFIVGLDHDDRTALDRSTSIADLRSRGLDERQRAHLDRLTERVNRRHRASRDHTRRYRSVLADNRASAGFRFSTKEMLYPIVGEHSDGARVWDLDGNTYVDITMGFGVHLFGHNPSFVKEALRTQLDRGIQLGPQSELAGEVAEAVARLTGNERVAFCNSGTEAVMTALRLAHTATRRDRIAVFAGSYHGHFNGTLVNRGHGNQAVPMALGIPPNQVANVLVLDYADPDALDVIRQHAHELAAVLVEPVQSRRPDLQPAAFLRELRDLTRASGIALVFDEMVTGFRIHPGGAQAWFGVQADLVTYGKVLGGGMPIGVVAGRARFMDGIDGGAWSYGDTSYPQAATTFFAGTFCKHPLTLAASRAVLRELEQQGPELQVSLNRRTKRMVDALNTHFEGRDLPVRLVRFGSLFRFVFPGNLDLLYYHLLDRGVYVWEGRTCFLSTAHTDEDIAFLTRAIQESVDELHEAGFVGGGASRSHVPARLTPPVRPLGPDEIPLITAQRQLWLSAQASADGSAAYNDWLCLDLEGSLDGDALQRAVDRVVARHEALRTVLSADGESQRVLATVDVPVQWVDLARGSTDAETRARTWMKAESGRGFDLVTGPLFAAFALRLGAERHWLVLKVHHAIADGGSVAIVQRELSALYREACGGAAAELPPPPQFRDYVAWHVDQISDPAMVEQERYWLRELSPPPADLELPTVGSRPRLKSYGGARRTWRPSPELVRRLKQFGARRGLTLMMTLYGAYAALMHRLSGQEDVVVGTLVSGRGMPGSSQLVGYCTHVLPLRSRLGAQTTFSDFLEATRQRLLTGYEHQDYPFARLIDKLEVKRDVRRMPLVSTVINLDRWVHDPEMGDLRTQWTSPPVSYSIFDLSVNVTELEGDVLVFDWDYNLDLFDADAIDRWIGHFERLLLAAMENPDGRVAEVPLGASIEGLPSRAIPAASRPDETTVLDVFAARVARTPDAVAVVAEDVAGVSQQLSYELLWNLAGQLARRLRAQGVGPDTLVGLSVERSPSLIIGVLAVLRAGGAWVSLDPSYPAERLRTLLDDAGVALLLADASSAAALPRTQVPIVELTRDLTVSVGPAALPPASVRAGNLAYVTYTSGSTGRPKGVLTHHGALLHLCDTVRDQYRLTSRDRVLQFTSASWDVFVEEVFPTLLSGAAVVMIPHERTQSVAAFVGHVARHAVSIVNVPGSYWEQWSLQVATDGVEVPDCLRLVVAGSEEVRGERLRDWQTHARTSATWCTAYGVTEATVTSTLYHPNNGMGAGSWKVPIGRPIGDVSIRLLDGNLQAVPVGVSGEMYIGGPGVARGYHGRPAETAARFVPDPFDVEGHRLYRTGDLARCLADGNLEYLGRTDEQVKLRGFRIEPGEIAATLLQLPGVRDALVLAESMPVVDVDATPESAEDRQGSTSDVSTLMARMSTLDPSAADALLAEVDPIAGSMPAPASVAGKPEVLQRRFPEFDLSFRVHDNSFVNPPNAHQRNWILQRAVDEFTDDVRHLHALAQRFVSGSERPDIQHDWRDSKAELDDEELVIEGQHVMQAWERPLMRRMSEIATETHGDVLEVGFGMAISATYIQQMGARSHTIIECNDEVIASAKKWRAEWQGRDPQRDIRIVESMWQDAVDHVGPFDAIFFDTYPLSEREYLENVLQSVTYAEHFIPAAARLLREGGVFTYYTNEIDSFSRRHQRLLFQHFRSFSLELMENLEPPPNQYWWADTMAVVKAIK